jgi:AcrR family transcriptional regulator
VSRKRTDPTHPAHSRERLLASAYELFRLHGIASVGVDWIVADSGVAKTTLYRHFESKSDLVVAAIGRHEEVWTRDWLIRRVERDGLSSKARLRAIFDSFDGWFQRDDYVGCFFANCLLESRDAGDPIHAAAEAALGRVREIPWRIAEAAGVADSRRFALEIQVMMLGSIVAAVAGEKTAARRAKSIALMLFELQAPAAA